MFLEKTSNELKGYFELKVFGFFIERFLNLAMNSNITIWNVQKIDNATLLLCTNILGYRKLLSIAKKTGCKMTISKKVGIPFWVKKHKKRPTFPVLFIAIALGIYFYNLHIWHIDIVGEFNFPIEEIQQELNRENVKIGALKKELNTNFIKNNIYMRRHDIAWIGIHFKGTNCTVEIVEANLKSKEDELDKVPCDIIANKDGMIYSINALEGNPLVKSGDIIKSGDILISGVITSEWSPTRYVNAKGEIYIKSWYTDKKIVQLEKDLVSPTGNQETKYELELEKYKINLGNTGTKYEKYDTIIKDSRLNLLGILELPIRLKQTIYQELDVETVKYSEEQAIENTIKEMENNILRTIGNTGKIVNKDIKTSKNENSITVVVTIECIEEIGTKRKLEG